MMYMDSLIIDTVRVLCVIYIIKSTLKEKGEEGGLLIQ